MYLFHSSLSLPLTLPLSLSLSLALSLSLRRMFFRLLPAIVVMVTVMMLGVCGNVVIVYVFVCKLRKNSQVCSGIARMTLTQWHCQDDLDTMTLPE